MTKMKKSCTTCHKLTVCYIYRFFLKICGIIGPPGWIDGSEHDSKKRGDALEKLSEFGIFCRHYEEVKEGHNYDILFTSH